MRMAALISRLAWATVGCWLMMAMLSALPCAAQSQKGNDPAPKPSEEKDSKPGEPQPGSAKADQQEKKGPAAPKLATLDEMLKVALEHNPDVRAAAARIDAAEAELDRTRLEVVQKVIAYRERWLQQSHDVEQGRLDLEKAQSDLASYQQATPGAVSGAKIRQQQKYVLDSQSQLQLAQDKLAEIEAELPFLLGRRPDAKQAVVHVMSDAKGGMASPEAALLDTARKAYQLQIEAVRGGESISLDAVFQWSRRWMEAELAAADSKQARLSAIESHLDRTRQLYKFAEAAYKAGAIGQAQVVAMQYYVAEAEQRLTQAKRP